jgi:hypothetical protein
VHKIPSLKSVKVVVRPREDSPGVPKSADGWYTPAEKGVLNLRDDLSSKSAMGTAVHELGHMVDHEQLGGGDHMATLKDIANPDTPMGKVGDAMLKSHAVQEIIGRVNEGRIDSYYGDYLMNPSEAFARAYTQWVAERSGNAELRESVTDDFKNAYGQWGGQDFKPIGTAMDELFRSQGLLNETIEKFNPNHDENGRFAETTGGTGTAFDSANAYDQAHYGDALRSYKTVGGNGRQLGETKQAFERLQDSGMLQPVDGRGPVTIDFTRKLSPGVAGEYNPADHTISVAEDIPYSPASVVFHEYGHSIDYNQLGHGRFASVMQKSPAAKGVMDAIKNTRQYDIVGKDRYWGNNQELFARAFAQEAANRAVWGDVKQDLRQHSKQWADDDFAAVGDAFENLFPNA